MPATGCMLPDAEHAARTRHGRIVRLVCARLGSFCTPKLCAGYGTKTTGARVLPADLPTKVLGAVAALRLPSAWSISPALTLMGCRIRCRVRLRSISSRAGRPCHRKVSLSVAIVYGLGCLSMEWPSRPCRKLCGLFTGGTDSTSSLQAGSASSLQAGSASSPAGRFGKLTAGARATGG